MRKLQQNNMQVSDAYKVGADVYRVYLNVNIDGPDANKARTDAHIQRIQSRLITVLGTDLIA